MKKRLLSFLLTAVMLVSMMPITVLAGGPTDPWSRLQYALNGTGSSADGILEVNGNTVKLLTDIQASADNMTLKVNGTKTIDLNGHVINGKIDDSNSVGRIIHVPGNANLTLTDSSAEKTGKITGGVSAGVGGAVYVQGGSFTMKGGTISGNSAKGGGGGVCVYDASGSFVMDGGYISGNTTNGDSEGGGVYVRDGKFTMNGGTISGNTATMGGGVYAYEGNVIMNGGKIAQNNGTFGGGVAVTVRSNFTMTGNAQITENISSAYGGGVYGYNETKLILGGSAQIIGNMVDGKTNNVHLFKNNFIPVVLGNDTNGASTPTSEMSVGVTLDGITGEFTDTNSDDYSANFFADAGGKYSVINIVGNKLKIEEQQEVTVDNITNGTVTTDAAEGKAYGGDIVTLTVTPAENYVLKPDTLKVIYDDGTSKNCVLTQDANDKTKYTFTMPSYDVIIKAEFIEEIKYAITVEDDGNGNATAKVNDVVVTEAKENTTVTLTAIPLSGYIFKEWQVDSPSNLIITDNAFTMPKEAVVVKAVFEVVEPDKYAIIVTGDGNGEASSDKNQALYKEEVTLTATPAEGFSFDYWETSPVVEIKDNKFEMPESSVLVKAHFKANPQPDPDPDPDPNPDPDPDPNPDPDPEPGPSPDEKYYAPLLANLHANDKGTIEWSAGDSLPLDAVKLLVEKPDLSLIFTFTYEGNEHTIFIPAGAFERYYDVSVPWYGPAWLILHFEKNAAFEYIVKQDDTIINIARIYHTTVDEILRLNPQIKNPNLIYPGDMIMVPGQK